MPEWYLVIGALAALSAVGLLWTPLLLSVPLLIAAVAALIFKAVLGGMHASVAAAGTSRAARWRMRVRTTLLYMAQPAARLTGRLRYGLSPWRRRSAPRLGLPVPRTTSIWSERWRAPDERVARLDRTLRRIGGVVFSGGDYERWDLFVRGGMLGSMRLRVAVEEHGAGRQLVRIRSWPRFSRIGAAVALAFAALAAGAALDGAWAAAAIMGAVVLLIVVSTIQDCATAAGVLQLALDEESEHARREYEPAAEEPLARAEPPVRRERIPPRHERPAGTERRHSRTVPAKLTHGNGAGLHIPARHRRAGHESHGARGVRLPRPRVPFRRRKTNKIGAWDQWKALPKVFPFLRGLQPVRLAVIVILTVPSAIIGLAEPWPLALVIDNVIGPNAPPRPAPAAVRRRTPIPTAC